jgi:hypothetical protein
VAIADDFEVQATGDIRYIGDAHGGAAPGYYTVIEFHRWLQDLADDATAAGDDLLDITDTTPSERSTDNIITLLAPFNIDDTAAEHLYDGSVSQVGGDVVYSGLVVVGAVEAATELQIIQNNAILTSYWGTGLNDDATQNILLRITVKTRAAGADIDGKRIRVVARELSDSYAEFSASLGQGNATAAIFTSNDLNNQTAAGTIATWTDVVNGNEGYNGLDVSGDASDEFYYSAWTRASRTINQLYERLKWIGRRGTSETLYGLGGFLFRGITHQWAYDTETGAGAWTQNEILSWGTGATAGTGALLAVDDQGTTGTMWIQLLTGVPPSNNLTVTGGTSTKTADVNGSVTARTVSPAFVGQSTGSAIIGAFGLGIEPADLTASDLLFDLTNAPINPPNNVQFSVGGLVSGEDRVLVGPELTGALQLDQLVLNTTLSGAAVTAVVVTTTIPSDTPAAGTIRIQLDSGIYRRVAYTSYTGSTFTIGSTDFSTDNATAGNDVFISYIDKLAGATSESFTVVFSAPRSLFIRVRDGGGTPIKTFETTGTLGSAGGSTTAIRTTDT